MHYAKVSKEFELEKLGKRPVEFTVPQVDTTPELETFYGGEKELVERNNKTIARSAIQSSVLRLKDSKATTEAEWNEQVKREQEATKGYKPEIGGGVSAKAAKASVDSLQDFATKHRDLFLQLNPDEVMAFLTTNALPEHIVAQLPQAA